MTRASMPHAVRDPHARPRAGLAALFGNAWANRVLILSLARRDVVGRYRGSWAGLAWSFFNPLLTLAIYTFVFATVFKTRWQTMDGGVRDFALVLFAGLIVHGILGECLQRAPALVIANANYVKRVIFPLDVLGWVSLSSALFHAGVSTLVLLCALVLSGQAVPATAWYLPVVLLPYALLALGLVWLLSATGVFFRDIGQFTGILSTALLFLAPVMYPATALPAELRPWLYLNPVSFIVEQVRDVLVFGHSPDWSGLGWYTLAALGVAWIGFWVFQRARRGFADVL